MGFGGVRWGSVSGLVGSMGGLVGSMGSVGSVSGSVGGSVGGSVSSVGSVTPVGGFGDYELNLGVSLGHE